MGLGYVCRGHVEAGSHRSALLNHPICLCDDLQALEPLAADEIPAEEPATNSWGVSQRAALTFHLKAECYYVFANALALNIQVLGDFAFYF